MRGRITHAESVATALARLEGRVTNEEQKPNLAGFWVYVGDFVAVGDPGNDPPGLVSTSSPPFQNDWGYADDPYQFPRFRHGLDGGLEIDGTLTSEGGAVSGTVAWTLPTEWRPDTDISIPTLVFDGANLLPAHYEIDQAGEVTVVLDVASDALPAAALQIAKFNWTGTDWEWDNPLNDNFGLNDEGDPFFAMALDEDYGDGTVRQGIEILQADGLYLIELWFEIDLSDTDFLDRSPTGQGVFHFGIDPGFGGVSGDIDTSPPPYDFTANIAALIATPTLPFRFTAIRVLDAGDVVYPMARVFPAAANEPANASGVSGLLTIVRLTDEPDFPVG